MDLTEISEGKTTFFVPTQDNTTQFPPGSAAIFFNRRMELNRDATILLLSILEPSEYLDAMGATGVRGLRVANECGIPVTINDREPEAIELIRQNAARFDLPVEIVQGDANALLSERAFDAVDLDPFGTPAPFVDAGVRAPGGSLSVTATDTAPLCGAHLKAGKRRYFAQPMNTEYHREVGLRILLGFVVRETIKYDRGIEPVFCFAREHFDRLHLRLLRGADAADKTLARIGFIHQCRKCPYREEEYGMVPRTRTCPCCGEPLQPVGPLWLGGIQNTDTLELMQEKLPGNGASGQRRYSQNSSRPAGKNCRRQATTITTGWQNSTAARRPRSRRFSPDPRCGLAGNPDPFFRVRHKNRGASRSTRRSNKPIRVSSGSRD